MTNDGAGFLSRKFLLAAAVLVIASWFRAVDLIAAEDWLKCATMVLTLYGLANVAQKIGTKTAPEATK